MFRRLCRGINSHKSLLTLLPEGNEYISVFTGALNVILKASANYEKLIESLSEALSTITDHVAECQVELELYETQEMKEAIANLYADIFLLLSDLMGYLTKKRVQRLLGSFNENLCKKYEDQISSINKKAQKIQRLAEQGSRAEIRALRLQLENLEQSMVAGQEGEARLRAELIASANRMEAERREVMRRREVPTQKQLMDHLAGTLNKMLGDEALRAVINARAAASEYFLLLNDQPQRASGFRFLLY
ncbi:hypothetical protein PG993_014847 [Apiospora rasikravindrae]|uniref:DUF7708 domain-containing protein n=1 Tax=Apiospora rasikravindrae TaxID=990691 RepID=A0ABR1RP16_9PEZI